MAVSGPLSQKNSMISPAASDLGLGDNLAQQLQDNLTQRKKQQQQLGAAGAVTPGTNPFSASAQDLLGGLLGGGVRA